MRQAPTDLGTHVVPVSPLTADLPGVGGRLRERPEDFFVEEQPLYTPCGDGEHVYLFVERRNLSTLDVARRLARHFGVRDSAVGFAGLKDKRAVTRQVFSIHTPGKALEDFPSIRDERLTVLWADRHANKLRRGHLAGNRFSIRIRGVEPTKVLVARATLDRLARVGVPNRIGEQRFGYMGRNHLIGRAIVIADWRAALDALLSPDPAVHDGQRDARELYARGEFDDARRAFAPASRTERRVLDALARGATPERAVRAIDRMEAGFFLTAFQSAVFNAVLDRRIAAGALGTLAAGDVAMKHVNRAPFTVCEETLAEPGFAERLARFEISPSGPMWGVSMLRASGPTNDTEIAALHAFGVSEADVTQTERRSLPLPGERRPLRVPLTDPDVEGGMDEHGPYVRVAFDLPRGAFATTVLREIMKPQHTGSPADDGEGPDEEPDPDVH
ncbi:MAG: tRNA pseudouridine(13) synthase TruD [Phycisphaerales bacterium]